ncbi:MAG: hypothetical protein JWR60_3871 [Polaromonas sp.]|nr:hypothetical protein [Polaromonas sp.]
MNDIDSALYLIESGKPLAMVKQNLAERRRVHAQTAALAKELGVKRIIADRLDGTLRGVSFKHRPDAPGLANNLLRCVAHELGCASIPTEYEAIRVKVKNFVIANSVPIYSMFICFYPQFGFMYEIALHNTANTFVVWLKRTQCLHPAAIPVHVLSMASRAKSNANGCRSYCHTPAVQLHWAS